MDSSNKYREINFLLIGLAGVGKSSLINMICDEDKAKAKGYKDKGFKGVTKLVEKHSKTINNITMNFYDTPGFGDQEVSVEDFIEQIDDLKKKELIINYIIYVNRTDIHRIYDFLKICFEAIKLFFGEDLSSNVICVSTHFKNFKNTLEDMNKLETEKQIYITEFLDSLRDMNFLIFEKNFLFSDITNPEKAEFVNDFHKFLDNRIKPLELKADFDEKKLEKIINKFMEKDKDIFGLSDRIDLEEYRKSKDEEKKIYLNGCLLGNSCTGKTSLFQYYKNKSKGIFSATTYIDIFSTFYHDSQNYYQFTLHDTPGQDKYKSLLPGIIKRSDIIFVVYDFEDLIESKHSKDSSLKIFESNYFIQFLKDNSPEESKIIILCNKIDLKEKYKEKIKISEMEEKIKGILDSFKQMLNYKDKFSHYFVSSISDKNTLDEVIKENLSQFSIKRKEKDSEKIKLELNEITYDGNLSEIINSSRKRSKRSCRCSII